MSNVSERMMAAIVDLVTKESGGIRPLVGTGHVKWPPVDLRVNPGDPPEARVDKLVVTVDFEDKGLNRNDPNR